MITLTAAAHKQMAYSAELGNMQGVPLRIAILEQGDGSFHYAMGFDEQRLPEDVFINVEGVSLVVSKNSQGLAEGMTIDYVELEAGKFEFIFLNPNDPTYVPPGKK
jgi:iron-sulfur cluster assembly protein